MLVAAQIAMVSDPVWSRGSGDSQLVQPKCVAQAMIQLVATAFHGGQK